MEQTVEAFIKHAHMQDADQGEPKGAILAVSPGSGKVCAGHDHAQQAVGSDEVTPLYPVKHQHLYDREGPSTGKGKEGIGTFRKLARWCGCATALGAHVVHTRDGGSGLTCRRSAVTSRPPVSRPAPTICTGCGQQDSAAEGVEKGVQQGGQEKRLLLKTRRWW